MRVNANQESVILGLSIFVDQGVVALIRSNMALFLFGSEA